VFARDDQEPVQTLAPDAADQRSCGVQNSVRVQIRGFPDSGQAAGIASAADDLTPLRAGADI
jgi:hypothetical protein